MDKDKLIPIEAKIKGRWRLAQAVESHEEYVNVIWGGMFYNVTPDHIKQRKTKVRKDDD